MIIILALYLEASGSSPSFLGENPYWVFVSFLYAWIAAKIAEQFSDVSSNWSEYEKCNRKWWYIPIWSQLTLAGIVVGTSWLGWTHVFVVHDVISPERVISPSSLLLIVDFFILGTYFCFVATVHKARLPGARNETGTRREGEPAYWIFLIFCTYVVWDFFAYFAIPRMASFVKSPSAAWRLTFIASIAGFIVFCVRRGEAWWSAATRVFLLLVTFGLLYFRIPYLVDEDTAISFWYHSWPSLTCALLAGIAFLLLRNIGENHPFRIMAADTSLIALVLFYRALKELYDLRWEHFMWGCFIVFAGLTLLVYDLGRKCLKSCSCSTTRGAKFVAI